MFTVILTEKAQIDFAIFKKNNPKGYKKIEKLLTELENHPKTGTGHVEQLTGNFSGYWSRRIDEKNGLLYYIEEEMVKIVTVTQMIGHYHDK